MAELLRLDSSRLYGSSNPGCVWGLFHMFDSYQRRETKKMLSYRRMRGSMYGLGTDIHMPNDEARGEDIVAVKGQNSLVNSKANKMSKISSKAHILNFIAKKLLKRKNNKKKTLRSSSQLTHTLSIHPLENSNFVPSENLNQTTSFRDNSTIFVSFDSTDSPAMNRHESLYIKGLIFGNDIRDTSQKFGKEGNYLLDEHIILKKKLFEARDALLKKKHSDPNGMTVEFSLLSKIFLDTLQLFNANREVLYSICQEQDYLPANDMPTKPISLKRSASLTGLDFQKKFRAFEALPGSYVSKKEEESKSVSSRWKELKQRLKGMLAEEKVGHRISMDRILDKLPSGRKVQEDEDGKGFLKYGHGFKFDKPKPRVQRSRSLTESMVNYSQLLDSFSINEVWKFSKRSKSARDGSIFQQRKLSKSYRSMMSNPEILRSHSFSHDGQSEHKIALEQPLHSDLALNIGGSDKLIKNLAMKPELEEISHTQEGKTKEESNIFETEEQPCSMNQRRNVPQFEEDDLNSKPEKTSPISVLDLNIEEPVSPVKFAVLADLNHHLSHENLEDQLSPHEEVKNDEKPITLLSQIDEKESSTYNYVKQILSKSGFEALLCQTEPSSMEAEASILTASDMPFEEHLIYDLINEVLFEIYEYSSIPSHWIARFHSKIRSMPKGSDLIEEVWAEIRWHIFSPMEFVAVIDAIIARNFSKIDGWMSLYRDAECFGLLLEQLILDDLIDEVLDHDQV